MSYDEDQIETELELENGDWIMVSFTRKTAWDHDSDYGADADGHRGMPADFVEDDFYEDVMVQNEEDGPWASLADLPAETKAMIEKALDQWLKENDPEPADPIEPDYEED